MGGAGKASGHLRSQHAALGAQEGLGSLVDEALDAAARRSGADRLRASRRLMLFPTSMHQEG